MILKTIKLYTLTLINVNECERLSNFTLKIQIKVKEKGVYSCSTFHIHSKVFRLCKTCNKIEDEEHFILECTINSKLRTDLFAILANENPNFIQFSSEQKLIYLLNPTTTAHVKIIGFYIIKSLELRTEVS